jgi:oligo-1,6-glucosidase
MKNLATAAALLISVCSYLPAHPQINEFSDRKWWKEAVVYQLYPRSFKDSDGDGVGDLKGIISKLDYIKSLGVDVVWLNPIYESPNDDNGYDISDYRTIMKDFGSMDDFDALLQGLHNRKIKLVMDLVVNHTSDEHEWFKQSRSSRNSPYRHYYHWWNAEKGKPTYRWSFFDVQHDAWKYDSVTDAYYLHYFSRKQPDLNWENPQVRKEVNDIMKFWANKGIDGFRMDAFQFVAKDTSFPPLPQGYEKNIVQYYAMGNGIHNYIEEMNAEVFSKYPVMTVAEGAGNSFEDAHKLVDPDRKELNMAYAFDAVDFIKQPGTYDLIAFKKLFTRWDSAFAEKGWLSVFLANHDNARMVSRYGTDSPAFRDVSASMLNTFLLTMRGTPYCYNGDELGMTNIRFSSIADYRDVQTINGYAAVKNSGGDTLQYLEQQKFSSRDNGRTPFQWNAAANAGFSTGRPWIKVNPNYTNVNVSSQQKNPGSVLNHFRKATALRKANPVLVYGKYSLVDKENPSVYAFTREGNGKKLLVLLNFTAKASAVKTGFALGQARLLLGNYTGAGSYTVLRPYEARVYQLAGTHQ